ncbi:MULTISPECIES: M10 family metallopeptidase C-terminal domain-containing protein [unclassified Pseudomonas]|uniref:M10 family metallopeptidase C-terminal domain-containing protein n=1 Tax=unclassified Pseudomonas TaxID=196821 RepID=UPI0021146096|nr:MULTISPECIES: M10 family metallopeptidase C-terminal domain-containing protein [unclassified Pseudomonas]
MPVKLTYSFIDTGSFFARDYSPSNEYLNGFTLSNTQQSAVISALSGWSAVANVQFSLVPESAANVGDLRFGGYMGMDSKYAAWAYFPDETPAGGDVWIGPSTDDPNPVKGSFDYLTFVHEIGHALGLKHPFDTTPDNKLLLDPSLDDVRFTVMSYNDSYSYQPTTPMLLDILAIQSLYGANTQWQAGNNVYSWAPTKSVFETIWDGGGSDTIDASNQLSGVSINLNPGQFSTIGKAFLAPDGSLFNSGLAIAYGTNIENAFGSNFNDTLIGNALDNSLVGLEGADTMDGGAGNDTYFVDNVGDVVIERGTSPTEIDSVMSTIDYTLGANVENLTLLGTDNLNGTGNSLNNRINGNAGNNILDGGIGADFMAGGTGNDTYIVDNVNDIVSETSTLIGEIDTVNSSVNYALGANLENLTLTGTRDTYAIGNALNNVLIGNDGNNTLNGGAGSDTMSGGKGNDTYAVDSVGDIIIEAANEGYDTVVSYIDYTLGANIEEGQLIGNAISLAGNELDNVLIGNALANNLFGGAGNDVINGGAGGDRMVGGLGDDTYIVDNTGDIIVEAANEGRDTVQASVNYTLSANIEEGQLIGNAASLTGNDLDNMLIGNAQDNTLNGMAGADTMDGGAGNDSYFVDNVGDVVIERDASPTQIDAVNSVIDYTLGANVEWLNLLGSDNLNGTGNALNNRITGNSGNNILDGGLGADFMAGGTGNDTYIVDNVNDVISETSTLANEIDTVLSSINWRLGANLENLTLTGTSDTYAIGNALNNVLIGNDGNNEINGGAGVDTMSGGKGNDTYAVDNAGDIVIEAANEGYDTVLSFVNYTLSANIEEGQLIGNAASLTGNSLDNVLIGNAQDNTLNGMAGADTMDGGAGNDSYFVDNVGDVVIERDASPTQIDAVNSVIDYTLGANVEWLNLLGSDNLNGTGNALNNRITGNSGNNILDGGLGADFMAGGTGNDTYIVDNVNDVISETSTLANEIDTVKSSISWKLGANLENLTLTGTANTYAVGNALNNVLTGNDGNNELNGGAGIDTMIGGKGDDSYALDQAAELTLIQENAAEGNDTLILLYPSTAQTNVVDLGISNLQNVENVTLSGAGTFTLLGNSLNNTLIGNDQANILDGGAGADTLTGGGGADTFVFNAVNEMGLGANRDVITDFNRLQGDKIDLTHFDANLLSAGFNGFTFIGADNFTGAGQVRFVDHVLSGNVSGNAGADFEIQLVGVNSFSANDLVA